MWIEKWTIFSAVCCNYHVVLSFSHVSREHMDPRWTVGTSDRMYLSVIITKTD